MPVPARGAHRTGDTKCCAETRHTADTPGASKHARAKPVFRALLATSRCRREALFCKWRLEPPIACEEPAPPKAAFAAATLGCRRTGGPRRRESKAGGSGNCHCARRSSHARTHAQTRSLTRARMLAGRLPNHVAALPSTGTRDADSEATRAEI